MTPAHDQLIENLSAQLRPVQRLAPPSLRAAVWIACVLALGAGLCALADISTLQHRLQMLPDLRWAALGAALTAVTAAIAAFQASVPGRSPWWLALPLPPVALWLGASGWGCLRPSLLDMHPTTPAEGLHCAAFIIGLSLPLSVLLFLLLRRAAPLHPGRVAAMAGLAAAAAAASLLVLFHPEDASAADLAMHAAAVGIVVVANEVWTRRLLHRAMNRL